MINFLNHLGPMALAMFGAVLSIVLGSIGSILGTNSVAQASAGAASEKPEIAGRGIIMSALPGSQGLYGLVGAIMIMNAMGVIADASSLDAQMALAYQFLFAAFPVAFTCLLSGIFQGKVAAAAINMIVKDPSSMGKAIIISALIETFAIFGLLVSILLIINIG